MPRFVGGDVDFVLQGEAYVVQALQQALAHEVIDVELGGESLIVSDHLLL